ncbi:MAG: helix-turn-helix domain-containing protein [Sedimentisphaerales bacterium]|nr:helix-turn-helix domain-containing protein [Sedimentisphaerales bacterium]
MNLEEAVGAELKACRRRKQISQEQLGFDAGVHRTYVSLIERGASPHTRIATIHCASGFTWLGPQSWMHWDGIEQPDSPKGTTCCCGTSTSRGCFSAKSVVRQSA